MTKSKKSLLKTFKSKIFIGTLLTLFLLFQVVFFLSLNSSSFCSSCHTIKKYVSAHEKSTHSTVSCGSCHPGKGISRIISGEITAFENFLSFLIGGKPERLSEFDQSICLNCHPEVKTGVIKAKVRVRHSDFLNEYRKCNLCHAGVAHEIKGFFYHKTSMLFCLECHDDSQASSDCSVCHAGRKKELLSKNLQIYGKFHPNNYLNIHGAEKSDKCQICHEENFCGRCHVFVKNLSIDLPHPESWIYTHWKKTDRNNVRACYACHEKKKCDDCHGLEMPHVENFLVYHAKTAKNYGVDKCLKCHDNRSCETCHLKHVHPNFGTFWTAEKVFQRFAR